LAANQENSDAQYHLGILYENGLGVPSDLKMALYWYTKSFQNSSDIGVRMRVDNVNQKIQDLICTYFEN